jgi:hypothetical protein
MEIDNLNEIPGKPISTTISYSMLYPEKCEKCKCLFVLRKEYFLSFFGKYVCCIHEGDKMCHEQKEAIKSFEEIEKREEMAERKWKKIHSSVGVP